MSRSESSSASTSDGTEPRLGVRLRVRHLGHGQQIKCVTVIDDWTREALAIDVAGSIRAERVIEVLGRIVSD